MEYILCCALCFFVLVLPLFFFFFCAGSSTHRFSRRWKNSFGRSTQKLDIFEGVLQKLEEREKVRRRKWRKILEKSEWFNETTPLSLYSIEVADFINNFVNSLQYCDEVEISFNRVSLVFSRHCHPSLSGQVINWFILYFIFTFLFLSRYVWKYVIVCNARKAVKNLHLVLHIWNNKKMTIRWCVNDLVANDCIWIGRSEK